MAGRGAQAPSVGTKPFNFSAVVAPLDGCLRMYLHRVIETFKFIRRAEDRRNFVTSTRSHNASQTKASISGLRYRNDSCCFSHDVQVNIM